MASDSPALSEAASENPDTRFGIYIHWPYCARKCPYCDFYSEVSPKRRDAELVAAIIADYEQRKRQMGARRLVSLYFGGGTPSLMPVDGIARILERIGRDYPLGDCEVTVEVNPASTLPAFLRDIRQLGVNRLSIGVQSFQPEILRFLERLHDARQALAAVESAREAGFDNLSIDLILATAPSTLALLDADLLQLQALGPEHVSAYILSVEEATPFGSRQAAGERLGLVDDDALAQYHHVRRRLRAAGYHHYEISNYALPGREAVHNSLYWSGAAYLGLGPGAHSYAIAPESGHVRGENLRDIAGYVDAIAKGGENFEFSETLDAAARELECVMTGLRQVDGLSEAAFSRRCGAGLESRFGSAIGRAVQAGALAWYGENVGSRKLALTERGLAVADSVILDFFMDEP